MNLYFAALITPQRKLGIALDEPTDLPALAEDPQTLYCRYSRACHVYRLFPDFRGGMLVLTSRASFDPVGLAMPVRPLVMLSQSQHRDICRAIRALRPGFRESGRRVGWFGGVNPCR